MAIELDGGVGIDSPTYTGDGSGLSNTGAMLQFQHTLFTGTSYLSDVGTTDVPIVGVSVDITPKFANSKMKIEVRWGGEVKYQYDTLFNILRNGLPINLPNVTGSLRRGLAGPAITSYFDNTDSTPESCSFFTIDTPNTTGVITYQLSAVGNGGVNIWTGRCFSSNTSGNSERMSCEITVTEIAI